MNNLKTIAGFYYAYFQLLPQFKSQLECFEYLNAEVCFINGKRLFLNYTDFEIQTKGIRLETSNIFYITYFKMLPHFRIQKKCFEYLNEIRNKNYTEPLYKNYNDFKMSSL